MANKLLCITDPATHPATDSTVELYRRLSLDPRWEFYHTHPSLVKADSPAAVVAVPPDVQYQQFLTLSETPARRIPWSSFDLVVNRCDEPLPAGYLETLISLEGHVRFAASPRGMLRAIGREYTRAVAGTYLPEWIATRSAAEAAQFIARLQTVVAKKERSYGGKGVFKIFREHEQWIMESALLGARRFAELNVLLEELFRLDPLPFEFVRYLPRVVEGDKRVLVLEGEILGAYLRISRGGGWINNGTLGGYEAPSAVLDNEREVVESTWRKFHEIGLPILGYDFLTADDGSTILSEINSGNVGGFGQLERCSGRPVFAQLLDWLATRSAA